MIDNNEQSNESSNTALSIKNRPNLTVPSVVKSDKHLLHACLSNSTTGKLEKDEMRRYAATLSMSTKVNGQHDATAKSIVYEIGARSHPIKRSIKIDNSDTCHKMSQPIEISNMSSSIVDQCQRKYTAFNASYKYADLSAVGYHLAKCLAAYTISGSLKLSDISCGQDLKLRSLQAVTENITASETSVFIPRITDSLRNPATFMSLVAACSAYGSTVWTDVVEISSNRAVLYTEHTDAILASGVYNALRILMSMYDESNNGAIMAMAIVKGLHSIASVIGHCDEGGLMRDILRVGEYQNPFGAIYVDSIDKYTAMPSPSANRDFSFTSVVDSILLQSAAMSALSDPGMKINGIQYATVFSTAKTEADNQAKDLASQISNDCSDFIRNYVENITRLFGTNGGEHVVESMLQFSMSAPRVSKSRHLKYQVVSPYYWIEPTSLFRTKDASTMTANGLGVMCGTSCATEMKAFENPKLLDSIGNVSMFSFDNGGIRKNPGVWFFQDHALNGLSNMLPCRFLPEKTSLSGGDSDSASLLTAKSDVAAYMWNRGQSAIPHPAEFSYVGGTMTYLVRHNVMNETTFAVECNHMFNKDELEQAVVTMTVSIPNRISNSKTVCDLPRKVRRDRTAGIAALRNSRQMFKAHGLKRSFESMFSATEYIAEKVVDPETITTYNAIPSDTVTAEGIRRRGVINPNTITEQSNRYRTERRTVLGHESQQTIVDATDNNAHNDGDDGGDATNTENNPGEENSGSAGPETL
jgi:hypothetical protein